MSAPLPAAYAWLPGVSGLPRMIQEGLKLYGTLEGPGGKNNPVILEWAAEVGLSKTYGADSVPWCGLFAAVVAKRAGKPVPEKPLWALNWARFGVPSPQPGLGDILTFRRDGGGHVALCVGEDDTAFYCLGGNQSDAVTITRIARARLYKARRPAYHVQPAGVKPYLLSSKGAPLSVNEA